MPHFPTIYPIWSSGPHEIYKSSDCYIFLLLSSFGPLVLRKFTRAENATLSYYFYHLVLWSSRNLQEQRIKHFPTIYPIWSSGPHEIYKSSDCSIFILLCSFGPLVLTKFTRAENATLSYYFSHLVFWSSRNLQEQRIKHFPTIYFIWSSGPHKIYKSRDGSIFLLLSLFGPLVLTKYTRAA
jgi:hypothetical protein